MVPLTDLRLHCPDLKTQQDEMLIRTAMESAPGISLVETDYRTGEVHIVTANQDGGTDVIDRLGRSGFPPELISVLDGGFERLLDLQPRAPRTALF